MCPGAARQKRLLDPRERQIKIPINIEQTERMSPGKANSNRSYGIARASGDAVRPMVLNTATAPEQSNSDPKVESVRISSLPVEVVEKDSDRKSA